MAALEATVLSRVTEALNVCAAGTFSSTVASGNLDRNATAISEAVREGALMIGSAILANKDHIHRNLYISSTATALTHGGELPDMAGEGDLVEIQRYSGGDYLTGTPRDVQKIQSYRLNPSSIYSSVAHTTQNSPLAGYYAIAKGRIYFTGYAAQGYFPALSRSTAASLVPDEYEGAWFCLGMGLSVKEGDNLLPIADYYMRIGQQQLASITNMGIIAPAPDPAAVARGNA